MNIGEQKAMLCGLQTGGGAHNFVFGPLAYGYDHAVCMEQHWFRQAADISILIKLCLFEPHSVPVNRFCACAIQEFYAIRYRIIHFTLAGGCFWTAAKHTYFFGAFSQRSTCNIHSGIACTDHCQMFAQIIYIGINEIINGKVDVTQAFPGDSKFFGTPYAWFR